MNSIGNIIGFSILFMVIGYLLGNILFGLILSKIFKVDLRSKGSGNVGSTNILRSFGIFAAIITFIWDSSKAWLSVFISAVILLSVKHLIPDYKNVGYIIYLGGLFATIGHCFPIQYLYLLFRYKFDLKKANKYRGGKGAATTAGFMLSISPWVFLICFVLFWIVFFITRYVSLSSMISISVGTILMLIPNLNYFYMLNILGFDNAIFNIKDISQEFVNPSISFSMNWEYLLFIVSIVLLNNIMIVYKHKENIFRLLTGTENKMSKKNSNKTE